MFGRKDTDWNIPFSRLSLDDLSILDKFHPMRLVSQAKHGTIHTFHAHLMLEQLPCMVCMVESPTFADIAWTDFEKYIIGILNVVVKLSFVPPIWIVVIGGRPWMVVISTLVRTSLLLLLSNTQNAARQYCKDGDPAKVGGCIDQQRSKSIAITNSPQLYAMVTFG
jgi:hypothetical protein